MNQMLTENTIRDIALAVPATTRVFEEFKIDYCCGGRRLLEEACRKDGHEMQPIIDRLNAVIAGVSYSETTLAPENKRPADLVQYIIAKHHLFTAGELERLEPLMAKVVMRHGDAHPELLQLQAIFMPMSHDLKLHMRKEEAVLFPFIKELDDAARTGEPIPRAHFITIEDPILMMTTEHDNDGARLRRMRKLTNDYALPEGACPSFTALYAGLQDLECDLHQHIHLENNVLFPAAIQLENR